MQKIYSHMNVAMVQLVKNELENRGIETIIQGEHLVAIIGGGAPADAWYELWLVDDARLPEAARVVQDIIDEAGEERGGRGAVDLCGVRGGGRRGVRCLLELRPGAAGGG